MSTSILPVLQAQFTRYGMSAIVIFGTFGNTILIILFGKRRQNACSKYLFYAAVMNFMNILFGLPIAIYSVDHPDPSIYSLAFCRIRLYLSHVWGQIYRYLVIAACIDRFILTTNVVRFRRFNQPWVSRCIIGFLFIFWHVASIHFLILASINKGRCSTFGLYSILYQIYFVIFACVIPLLSMSFYGFRAYFSMKKLHARIQPIGNPIVENPNMIVINIRDRSLLMMVVTEVVVYVITTCVYPIIYLEIGVTNYIGMSKSVQYIQTENFMFSITLILLYFNNAAPFYTYFLASKAFRADVKQLFIKLTRGFTVKSDTNAAVDPRPIQH